MSDVVFVRDLFLDEAIEFGLLEVVLFLQDKIIEITPRDKDRLPQTINRKDGKAPYRSSYYKPVMIGGNWYEWVSWNLKKSIWHERLNNFFFLIWVRKGPATEYARSLEFGTVHMAPRSFVRKWIFDNLHEAKKVFERAIKLKLEL